MIQRLSDEKDSLINKLALVVVCHPSLPSPSRPTSPAGTLSRRFRMDKVH